MRKLDFAVDIDGAIYSIPKAKNHLEIRVKIRRFTVGKLKSGKDGYLTPKGNFVLTPDLV